jgi:hypothetical protein
MFIMKKRIEEEEEEGFGEKMTRYVNNRCLRKPRRNKPAYTKYRNDGAPVGTVNHVYGMGKNYAVAYSPRKKKLKGWQKNRK